jgi:dihydropteroate synthase
VRAALPDTPISIDTRKPDVALAAIEAGADIVNDVAAVTGSASLARVAAARQVPYVITDDRPRSGSSDLVADVIADLEAVVASAEGAGCERGRLIVDPGFGFGMDAPQNLELLRGLDRLGVLGLPVLLGASRKSTIGRVLDLPPQDRLEGTIATTVLAVTAGVDIVRVHDVQANVRAARMADAVVRGWHPGAPSAAPSSASGSS